MNKSGVIIAVSLLIVFGISFYAIQKIKPASAVTNGISTSSVPLGNNAGSAQDTILEDSETGAWSLYKNNDVGFSLLYPKEFVQSNFRLVDGGGSGKAVIASFIFPAGWLLQIAAERTDYTVERDWNWRDVQGYVKQNGKYYLKLSNSKLKEVTPTEFWNLKIPTEKAIALYKKDFGDQESLNFYAPELLVVANSYNPSFPAVAFELDNYEATNTDAQFEIDIVKQIVSNLEFTAR